MIRDDFPGKLGRRQNTAGLVAVNRPGLRPLLASLLKLALAECGQAGPVGEGLRIALVG